MTTTLSDVLHDTDPVGNESRSAQARALTRSAVLNGPRSYHYDVRPTSRLRTLAIAAAFAVACVAAAVFGWRHASVDAVAAVRFEARLAESNQTILANRDILTAQMVPGSKPSTFSVALTFTPEGAEKMRQATQEHIGEHLQLIIDNQVVMAPLIRSAISTAATLTGDYTWEQASRIVDGLLKGKLELRNDK
jgi:preprotein translocase subunit SecD